jgi:hypothetical protein
MKRTRQATIALVLLALCAVGFGIYFIQNSHTTTTPSPTQFSTNPPPEPTPTASASPTPSPERTPSPTTQTPSPTQTIMDDNASNPRILCSTWESRASQRFSGDGSIVVANYYPDGEKEPTYLPTPQTPQLSLTVTNNNSIVLYNSMLEFHYQTSAGDWVTAKATLDSLGVQERRIVNITLINPALAIVSGTAGSLGPYRGIRTVSYVLSTHDFEMHAYGYASK